MILPQAPPSSPLKGHSFSAPDRHIPTPHWSHPPPTLYSEPPPFSAPLPFSLFPTPHPSAQDSSKGRPGAQSCRIPEPFSLEKWFIVFPEPHSLPPGTVGFEDPARPMSPNKSPHQGGGNTKCLTLPKEERAGGGDRDQTSSHPGGHRRWHSFPALIMGWGYDPHSAASPLRRGPSSTQMRLPASRSRAPPPAPRDLYNVAPPTPGRHQLLPPPPPESSSISSTFEWWGTPLHRQPRV